MTAELLQSDADGVLTLTLNRPDVLNAITPPLLDELTAALRAAAAGRTVRAVIITGAGRGFCSGQDLRAAAGESGLDVGAILRDHYAPAIRVIRSMDQPVIAAVNGVAAGAGCNVALACDIVIAGRSGSFVQSFARIGLIPDSGGTWFLPHMVGDARARGLALLAEPLPAEKAESWGLIWKCVDDAALAAEAQKMCEHFAAAPTQGLALIKRALNASAGNTLDAQLDLERDLQSAAREMPDYAEGVRAFMAKRKPNFSGRS